MNRDIEIALLVAGRYGHLPRPQAVKLVAHETGFSASGVSGMATRGLSSSEGQTQLMAYRQANAPKITPNQLQIAGVVEKSRNTIAQHKNSLDTTKTYHGIFISDIHIPKAEPTVLRMFYDILNDIPDVAYITAMNDALDFPKLSMYPERRPLHEQIIDADVSTSISIYANHIDFIKRIKPDALQIAIVGNHDMRVSTHGADTGINWTLTKEVMQSLYDRGVLWPDDLTRPNVFFVNQGLVWLHGWFASSNRISNLVKNHTQMMHQTRTRYVPDMVMGHTHDLVSTPHHNARLYNAGCFCDMNPHYMKYTPRWKWGFTVSGFNPFGTESYTQLVEISRDRERLIARYNGKQYNIPYSN